jgi:hypothetical protein
MSHQTQVIDLDRSGESLHGRDAAPDPDRVVDTFSCWLDSANS